MGGIARGAAGYRSVFFCALQPRGACYCRPHAGISIALLTACRRAARRAAAAAKRRQSGALPTSHYTPPAPAHTPPPAFFFVFASLLWVALQVTRSVGAGCASAQTHDSNAGSSSCSGVLDGAALWSGVHGWSLSEVIGCSWSISYAHLLLLSFANALSYHCGCVLRGTDCLSVLASLICRR